MDSIPSSFESCNTAWYSRFHQRTSSLVAARGRGQRRSLSGAELSADSLWDALLNEAEQFGFDVVAGELERELPGALTVTGLRVDLVDGVLDGTADRLKQQPRHCGRIGINLFGDDLSFYPTTIIELPGRTCKVSSNDRSFLIEGLRSWREQDIE